MAEVWKQWRGQIVDEKFPLLQYLCGSDQCATFLTSVNQQRGAIKLIPAVAAAAAEQLQRWQQAARLSHPHLLKLLDAGQWTRNGHFFLYVVTEFADEDLSQILPQRALTAREVRDMLLPMLSSLSYLHANKFVHGHLKPSNFLAIGDQLKVSSDCLHAEGELVHGASTPSLYLAPEVDDHGLSAASEIWSLGIVMVEALTQRPPVWTEKQHDPKVSPSLPDPFREIAENCLRRDPAQRWTIDQIESSLGSTLPTIQKQKVPVNSPITVKTSPAAKRNFAFLALAGAVVIIAVLLGARFAGRSSQNPPESPATQTISDRRQPSAGSSLPSSSQQASLQPANESVPASSRSAASGEVLKRVVPDVPRSARNTIQGTVRVSVLASVDPSGNVSATRFENHGPSAYFANLAMKAAKEWKFKSPQVDGREVASNWTLQFEFRRGGTNVRSTQRR